jgi:hypothetical protein
MSAKRQARNGKPASMTTTKRSVTEAASRNAELHRLLAYIYNCFQRLDDPAANKVSRRDFVFHMTDWEGDLCALADLYRHPERFSKDDAKHIVAGFLYHATAHIKEAARLMLDWEPDYFLDSPKPKKTASRVKPAPRPARAASP